MPQLRRNRGEKGRLEVEVDHAKHFSAKELLKALILDVLREQAQVQDCVYGIIFLGTVK